VEGLGSFSKVHKRGFLENLVEVVLMVPIGTDIRRGRSELVVY
jgi:hypothetical protein